MNAEDRLTRAAVEVGGATFLSRILGFIRDMIIAKLFGAQMEADAFFVAFRIPNLLRRLLAEGALSSAFIPVFTEYLTQRTQKETEELANVCLTVLTAFLVLLVIVCVLLTEPIVWAIAPGFSIHPEKFELTVLLTRIMFPYILFISLAAVVMGILNSYRIFLVPALTPVLLNLSIIGFALFLSPRLSEPSMGLAVGVLVGGVLQLAFQIPFLMKRGHRFRMSLNRNHPGLTRIGKLILPSVLGLAVLEVNLFVDTLLASLLAEGSVSYLYYGNRLVQFPLGTIGIAMGIAALPTLSSLAAQNNREEMKRVLSFSLRFVFFLTIPAMVGLILLRDPIINVLFERGEFSRISTFLTGEALLFYAVGLCAFTSTKVLVTAFYSQQDTRTPVRVANYCMLANIFFNLILMGPLRHGGLALATSLSSLLNAGVLLYLIRNRWQGIEGDRILRSLVKLVLASVGMGIVIWIYTQFFFQLDAPLINRVGHLAGAIVFPSMIYFLLLRLMGSEELDHLKLKITRRLGRSE